MSNKNGELLRKEVECLNIKHLVEFAFGAEDGEYDKPHKNFFNLALPTIQKFSQNHHITYIGDSPIDYEFAQNCSMDFVFIHAHTLIDNVKNAYDCHYLQKNSTKFINNLII